MTPLKAVTREDIEKAIDDFGITCGLWYDTREPKEFERVKSKQAELEWMVSQIIQERDEAIAEAKSEVAELQLHCACEFEERIEATTEEHYMFPRVTCLIHKRLDDSYIQWKRRAEEAERALSAFFTDQRYGGGFNHNPAAIRRAEALLKRRLEAVD